MHITPAQGTVLTPAQLGKLAIFVIIMVLFVIDTGGVGKREWIPRIPMHHYRSNVKFVPMSRTSELSDSRGAEVPKCPPSARFKQKWLHNSDTIVAEPLKLITINAQSEASDMIDNLYIIPNLVREAFGRELVPARLLAEADIILVGPYTFPHTRRSFIEAILLRHRHHALVWSVCGEAGENNDDVQSCNCWVDLVDAAFGHELACPPPEQFEGHEPKFAQAAELICEMVSSPKYHRMPWWITSNTAEDKVALHPDLYKATDPEQWARRPRFAAQMCAEDRYPRALLHWNLTAVGRQLDQEQSAGDPYGWGTTRARKQVDAPGLAFHNFDLPENQQTTAYKHMLKGPNGKIGFLRNYRYNIQPENSRSLGLGYNTEKMPQALLAHTVPIYWGDEFGSEVFNPKRVLMLRDGQQHKDYLLRPPQPDLDPIVATVRRLETDPQYRRQFFAEPILASTADEWMAAWRQTAIDRLQAGRDALACRYEDSSVDEMWGGDEGPDPSLHG